MHHIMSMYVLDSKKHCVVLIQVSMRANNELVVLLEGKEVGAASTDRERAFAWAAVAAYQAFPHGEVA